MMDHTLFSTPVSMQDVQITDTFWKKEMELIRTEVIPYQWNALNDQVEGAAPSYCMHNFKAAAKLNKEKAVKGAEFKEPVYTFRGFESLPKDPKHPDDNFYGYVFQDSDFYKWIEAVSYSLMQHPDEKLEALADEAISVVCSAAQEDGYLDTYYILNGKDKIFSNLRDHHELYCLGHLLEGAVAYYQATKKRALLDTACHYADYVASRFGTEDGKCKGYPGHEIAEMALVRLYETTGNETYLNLSRYFIDERGRRPYYFDKEHPEAINNKPEDLRYAYHQAHLPVREQDEAVGHAVRAVYLYSGMTDIARLTGDESLFLACQKLWNSAVNQKMYVTGGIGGTHIGEAFSFPYDLPNDTAYAETCASIGLIFWARRMLQIKPDSHYADIMERALYNGVLSGMSLDGKSFFYVNPLEVNPEACHKDERKFHVKPVRQKWFGCACCPPNLARLLSSVSSYAFTENEDALFVHLYIGGQITKQVHGTPVTLQISSDFPWNGDVKIKVNAPQLPFTLALRIPGWCKSYSLESDSIKDGLLNNGCQNNDGFKDSSLYDSCLKDGYLYITRTWSSDETLTLHLPMEVQLLQANTRVREDIGKVALVRGPIVYCLEEVDNGKDLHLITLDCDSKPQTEEFHIQNEPVISILAHGYRETKQTSTETLYHSFSKSERTPVQLRFIPYYTWANRGENEMSVWSRI